MACALGKTISEVLKTETMPRFSATLKHLPRVEYDYFRRMQVAFAGGFPSTWEEYVGLMSSKPSEELDRPDADQIQEFQSEIADLARRSREIQAFKRSRRSSG